MSLSSSEDLSYLSDDGRRSNASSSSSSSDDGSGGGLPPPPLQQNYFAPPFYGRPPTPLPPSPSLTSLLRPSRPTTPDASDDEVEPVPRASPKVPTYEYYGFVLYLFSSLTFLIYVLWSYLPSPFLHALGIYYYPNRWWSLAIPSFLVMGLAYMYVALSAYNTEILTYPPSAVETIVDEAAKVAVVDSRGRVRAHRRAIDADAAAGSGGGGSGGGGGGGRVGGKKRHSREGSHRDRAGRNKERDGILSDARGAAVGANANGSDAKGINWKTVWDEGTDAVMDIPLGGVCEVLYGDPHPSDDDLE